VFWFALWPFSKRRQLERDKAEALRALDLAEAREAEAVAYLKGVMQMCVWHDAEDKAADFANAKGVAFDQINEARRVRRRAERAHLKALDALNAYKKGEC
jgi:hypothetical protein